MPIVIGARTANSRSTPHEGPGLTALELSHPSISRGVSTTGFGRLRCCALRGFEWVEEGGRGCGNPLWERLAARLSRIGNVA
jgi:hypothetical protein